MKIKTAFLTLIILISISSCKKTDEDPPSGEIGVRVGQIAPDFTLPDKDGNEISLSDFNDQYILIDFWASWCHYCRDENPQLVSLYANYKAKGFEIVGVSIDTDKNNWLEAIADDGIEFVQLCDLQNSQGPVPSMYGIISVPHMVLINPDGIILLITSKASDVQSYLQQKLD